MLKEKEERWWTMVRTRMEGSTWLTPGGPRLRGERERAIDRGFVRLFSGGLISKGHPLGATGLAQCAELNWQVGMREGKGD